MFTSPAVPSADGEGSTNARRLSLLPSHLAEAAVQLKPRRLVDPDPDLLDELVVHLGVDDQVERLLENGVVAKHADVVLDRRLVAFTRTDPALLLHDLLVAPAPFFEVAEPALVGLVRAAAELVTRTVGQLGTLEHDGAEQCFGQLELQGGECGVAGHDDSLEVEAGFRPRWVGDFPAHLLFLRRSADRCLREVVAWGSLTSVWFPWLLSRRPNHSRSFQGCRGDLNLYIIAFFNIFVNWSCIVLSGEQKLLRCYLYDLCSLSEIRRRGPYRTQREAVYKSQRRNFVLRLVNNA